MNNDDLISRQAAIDAAMITPQKWDGMYIQDLNCRLRDTLNALPSVQPEIEPKTGHWIAKDDYDGDVYYTCSRCEEPWVTIEGTPQENRMNYCPHCGAKLKGETE